MCAGTCEMTCGIECSMLECLDAFPLRTVNIACHAQHHGKSSVPSPYERSKPIRSYNSPQGSMDGRVLCSVQQRSPFKNGECLILEVTFVYQLVSDMMYLNMQYVFTLDGTSSFQIDNIISYHVSYCSLQLFLFILFL